MYFFLLCYSRSVIFIRYEEQPKEFVIRPSLHSKDSSRVIETYEPWMYPSKGNHDSSLKVLSRFLYHQRWVFTLHPKRLDSTTPPDTVSKILKYIAKCVIYVYKTKS